MSVLRAIRDDLVEKRLWPVAILLVALMIGVPVVLARGGSAAAPAPLPVPPPVKQEAKTDAIVVEQPRQTVPTGRYHDPFRGSHAPGRPSGSTGAASTGTAKSVTPAPAASSSSPSSGSSSSSSSPSSSSAPASSGGSSQATTVTTPATTPTATPVPTSTPATPGRYFAGYRVDLSWGDPSAPRQVRDADRLSVLRAAGKPAVLFLGVRHGGDTAVFLVVGQGTPTGDGRCRPSADFCHVIELSEGDSEFLDVPTATGVTQLELHVDKLAERRAATTSEATSALKTRSKPGTAVLADVIKAGRIFVRRYVYSPQRGILVFSTRASQRTLPPTVAPAPGQ